MEEETKIIKPPCSKWRIWEGVEIEGFTDLNQLTLFVRDATYEELDTYMPKYSRVFFDSEYTKKLSKKDVVKLKSYNNKMVFGIMLNDYISMHNNNRTDIIKEHQIYLQINDFNLKPNDHIKIGTIFKEETFLSGTGKHAEFNEYFKDKKLA